MLLFVRLYINHPITGDEPHYMIIDYSLTHDRDLDLANNYSNGDYLAFYPIVELEPHAAKNIMEPNSSSLHSTHGVGLPLFLLGAFMLAGKTGAIIMMLMISTAVVWLSWLWTYMITKNSRVAIFTAFSLLACVFFNGQAGYIYPDLLIAALTLASLIIINGGYYKTGPYQILLGLILGAMVLVHFKTLVLVIPLLLILVYVLWSKEKRIPWITLIITCIFIILFLITTHFWFGVWNPRLIYSSVFTEISLSASPLQTVPAMLFDSNRGLLVYNPILLLAFIGVCLWYHKSRITLITTLITILPSIFLLITFNEWQGGFSPPGRYIMTFLPVLMPAVGFPLMHLRTVASKSMITLLLVATVVISVQTTILRVPYIATEASRTRSVQFINLEEITGVKFDKLLPNYSNKTSLDDSRGEAKLIIGYTILASLLIYGYFIVRNEKRLGITK